MSKYEPLWKHLQADGSRTLRITFEEINNLALKGEICYLQQIGEPRCLAKKQVKLNLTDYINQQNSFVGFQMENRDCL
jgi:hypothetical protein